MTVIPINTDNTSNLPKQITIKEQFEIIKILGILFNEDFHYANQINWETILEKMEKHINKLSTRTLSLYGKTIIINTLILSKTFFLSNVFPIDTKTTQQIHKKVFQYIWKNKQPDRPAMPSNRGIWWYWDTLVMLLSNLTRPSSNQTN